MDKHTEGVVAGIIKFLKKYNLTEKLPEIAAALQEEAKKLKNRVVVESAIELEKQDRVEIEAALKDKWQVDTTPEYRVTPNLVGGMRINIGDQVLDMSVKNKLEKIYEQV